MFVSFLRQLETKICSECFQEMDQNISSVVEPEPEPEPEPKPEPEPET